MTYPTFKAFDPILELHAIKEYLAQRWENLPPTLWTVLTFLGNVGARDGLRFIDKHCLFEPLCQAENQREALLNGKLPFEGATYYDRPSVALNAFLSANSGYQAALLNQDRPWNWDQRLKSLTTEVLDFCPELKAARPLGWDALAAGYSNFDSLDEYTLSQQAADEAEFRGTLRESTLGGTFVFRTSLPVVMYASVGQGISPAESLVGAVYAHVLLASEAYNSAALVDAVLALPLKLDSPDLVFDLDLVVDPQSSNPHLRGLLAYLEAENKPVFVPADKAVAAFNQAKAQHDAYAAMSEEERLDADLKAEAELDALVHELEKEFQAEAANPDAGTPKFVELLKRTAPELVAC